MPDQKKGNVHQEPHKQGVPPNEKNVNPDTHKKGHDKEHDTTERRPK